MHAVPPTAELQKPQRQERGKTQPGKNDACPFYFYFFFTFFAYFRVAWTRFPGPCLA
jgi:hypothetical protein